jgi:AI-2 transport protein TqsA
MNAQLKQQQNWVVTASLSTLAVLAISVALYFTRDILIPFVIAIFIGSLVSPLMDVMELKWKWRHSISIVVALAVVGVAATLFGAILMGSINTVVNGSPDTAASFKKLSNNVSGFMNCQFDTFMGADEITDESKTEVSSEPLEQESIKPLDQSPPPVATTTAEGESPMQKYALGLVPQIARWIAGISMTLFSGGTLTLIFAMFVLAGRDPKVIRQGVYAEIDTQVRSYISTKVALSLGTGVLVWATFKCIGVFWERDMPMAAVFGVVAFLLNFIPSVGSIISTVIPVPFALAMVPELFRTTDVGDVVFVPGLGPITFLLAVVCLPGCVQMLIGNVLEPKLMGNDLQLHPITILLALAIWGLLWGPIGMLLAVPMTAIIRIVLMKFEITQIAGKALAGELPDLDAAQKKAAGVEGAGAA